MRLEIKKSKVLSTGLAFLLACGSGGSSETRLIGVEAIEFSDDEWLAVSRAQESLLGYAMQLSSVAEVKLENMAIEDALLSAMLGEEAEVGPLEQHPFTIDLSNRCSADSAIKGELSGALARSDKTDRYSSIRVEVDSNASVSSCWNSLDSMELTTNFLLDWKRAEDQRRYEVSSKASVSGKIVVKSGELNQAEQPTGVPYDIEFKDVSFDFAMPEQDYNGRLYSTLIDSSSCSGVISFGKVDGEKREFPCSVFLKSVFSRMDQIFQ